MKDTADGKALGGTPWQHPEARGPDKGKRNYGSRLANQAGSAGRSSSHCSCHCLGLLSKCMLKTAATKPNDSRGKPPMAVLPNC